jgi:signal recognition particle receptor subunit beta
MEILRIVVTGSVGVGKTSFVRAISEIDVVDTDKRATDETALIKSATTVAMDFGRLTFAPNQSLHLYGTPGQSRFDFMWDMLITQADAYILLVPAHRPQDFYNCARILKFMNQRVQIPMLVGLTHTDCPDAWHIEDIALALGLVDKSTRPPFMIVNATDPASVLETLIAVIQEIIHRNLLGN